MPQPELTEGALATIMTGGVIEDPVMQVLGNKKIMGQQDKERYRLLVSDGKYQISFAMLATQLNEKVTNGEIANNTVIRVKKYITSMIKNAGQGDKRVMVILELDIVMSADEVSGRIGNPVALPDDPSTVLKKPQSNGHQNNGMSSSTSTNKPATNPTPKKADQSMQGELNTKMTYPISSLSPYQNKWVIKARVANKSPMRTWSNSRGEGKLFSVELMDETGEIRATAFKDQADKFFEVLEVDKMYYISKCAVKMANKQFNALNNDYEMTFTNETVVQPCFDDAVMPQIQYKFVPIENISQCEPGNIIDVIGVCQQAGDVMMLVSKTTNRELKKREVTLVDQSTNAVALTLWGDDAENFDGSNNPIIAVRGAKVGEFGGGKNVSVLMSSLLKLNPDIPDAHRLRGWYDNTGKNENMTNISARSAGTMAAQWLTFRDVKKQKLGASEKGDYYQVKAAILLISSNNAFYKACPQDNCNKKLVDMKNGMFRCEKCNREFPDFKFRLITQMNLGDSTGSLWASAFTEESEKILKKTSQEVGTEYEADEESLGATIRKAIFQEFIFRCRAKNETYNDETRLKTTILRATPIDYKEYNAHLISKIKQRIHM